ncbi:MAG: hypothetical protein ABI690_29625 [Chloroflexota bacterium]
MKENPQFDAYKSPKEEKQSAYLNQTEHPIREALKGMDGMAAVMLLHGILTEAQADIRRRYFETYLVEWTAAEWLLHEHPEGEGALDRQHRVFLTSWLGRHPEFVSGVLEGEWPERLPKPSIAQSEK